MQLDPAKPSDAAKIVAMALEVWSPPQGVNGATIKATFRAMQTVLDTLLIEEPSHAVQPESP